MTITEAMRTYRLQSPTTPEDLESRFSGMDGKMLTFADKIVITGYYYNVTRQIEGGRNGGLFSQILPA